MTDKELITISEAASILGVSIDTLRRWDKSGKLTSIKSTGGHRLYHRNQLELYLNDLFITAKDWVFKNTEISPQFYCANSAAFQTKLITLQNRLAEMRELSLLFPLIVAVAGEIGNNSFDHNLGNWPDIPGVFFSYSIRDRKLVLADRGQFIRQQRVQCSQEFFISFHRRLLRRCVEGVDQPS